MLISYVLLLVVSSGTQSHYRIVISVYNCSSLPSVTHGTGDLNVYHVLHMVNDAKRVNLSGTVHSLYIYSVP